MKSRWGKDRPGGNIDDRRVPNLMVFFSRNGEVLSITSRAQDYQPGDLVTWDLGNGAVHIGMVVDQKALLTRRNMIVHNIGAGPKMEDVLFDWKITGHYRYFGPPKTASVPALRDKTRGRNLDDTLEPISLRYHGSGPLETARNLEYKRKYTHSGPAVWGRSIRTKKSHVNHYSRAQRT